MVDSVPQKRQSGEYSTEDSWDRWESEFGDDAPPAAEFLFTHGAFWSSRVGGSERRDDYLHLVAKQIGRNSVTRARPSEQLAVFIKNEVTAVMPDFEWQSRQSRDVRYISECLADFMHVGQGRVWLTSYNENLLARPVDAFANGNIGLLIEAIDAQKNLAY